MTSVTGIGSSSSSQLLQMLQELAAKRAAAASASAGTSQASNTSQAGMAGGLEAALSDAGLSDSQLGEVKDEISSAISSILGQSDNGDPREAIGRAIDGILQNHGVDTDALKTRMQGASGRPPGPPPGGAGGPGGPGGQGFDQKISDALTAAGVDSSKLDEIKDAIRSAVDAARQQDNGDQAGPGDGIKDAVHGVLDQYGIDQRAFDAEMESGMQPPRQAGAMAASGGTSTQSSTNSLISYLNNSSDSTDSYSWLTGLFQIIDEQV